MPHKITLLCWITKNILSNRIIGFFEYFVCQKHFWSFSCQVKSCCYDWQNDFFRHNYEILLFKAASFSQWEIGFDVVCKNQSKGHHFDSHSWNYVVMLHERIAKHHLTEPLILAVQMIFSAINLNISTMFFCLTKQSILEITQSKVLPNSLYFRHQFNENWKKLIGAMVK